MKIRMKVELSGGRGDGRSWPVPGSADDTITVGDREGAELCAAGLAAPVTDDEEQPETRPARVAAEKRTDPPAFATIDATAGAAAVAAQDAARAASSRPAAAPPAGKASAAKPVTPARTAAPKPAPPAGGTGSGLSGGRK